MATAFVDFSTVADNNTSVGSANVAENCPPSGINNAIRQEIAYEVDYFLNAGTIASASTTDLGTISQGYIEITGTTTITALGTPTNKVEYICKFAGALTLTHNATSLILPGGQNITTAAGDVARFRHEGSGNWRCTGYVRASGINVLANSTATSGHALISGGPGVTPAWSGLPGGAYAAKTAEYTVIAGDNGDTIDFTTAGVAALLTAAATLGSGFTVTIANTASSGDITITPDGTETLDGLDTRLLRPGDRVTIQCTGSVWKTLHGVYSFVSSGQAYALNTIFTVAHGLGETPTEYALQLKCTDAGGDNGYSQNDIVEVDIGQFGESYGSTFRKDATNLVLYTQQTYAPSVRNKATNAQGSITVAKWAIVLSAKVRKG
jgi:hypothetical protein